MTNSYFQVPYKIYLETFQDCKFWVPCSIMVSGIIICSIDHCGFGVRFWGFWKSCHYIIYIYIYIPCYSRRMINVKEVNVFALFLLYARVHPCLIMDAGLYNLSRKILLAKQALLRLSQNLGGQKSSLRSQIACEIPWGSTLHDFLCNPSCSLVCADPCHHTKRW